MLVIITHSGMCLKYSISRSKLPGEVLDFDLNLKFKIN
jgi:hypothetical protein